MVFDSLGRQTTVYTGYNYSDTTYTTAISVTGDTILEQTETVYDAASNAIQANARQRYHNATGTGPLGTPTSAQPLARVTYMTVYPDALGRTVATANYGTNGGTVLNRSSTIPARSDTCLVTSTTFNARGEAYLSTDPVGTVMNSAFDDAGRRTSLVENYIAISSSSSSSSSANSCGQSDAVNQTTNFTYSPDGLLVTITAINATTGNQTSTYTYGTTLNDSAIASSQLKRYESYPDSVSGSDQIAFTYNRQSRITTKTDQNGTVHSYDFDLLGRQTADRITSLGSGIDNAVLRILTSYEVRGLVRNITSLDNATVGQGNVVNDVQNVYNSFQQLTAEYQSHSGTVNVSTTPNVQYAYANGSANTIRPTSMTFPNGRVLTYSYGTANGTNDAASRIASLIDNDGVTHLVDYSYLGASMIVQVNEPQPAIQYTLIGIQGGKDPATGDIYRGLDLFSRVKDLIWSPSGSSSSSSSSSSGPGTNLVRIQHGYDRAGNRLWRKDLVGETFNAGLDEIYGYDALYRLKTISRGTLNSTQTAIQAGTGTFNDCWTLDSTGNWNGFREDDNGNGNWNLVQSRTANGVNEITGISNSVGSAWANPAYDRAGNMTTIPQPAAPASSYAGTYDAWNRLVKLVLNPSGQTVHTSSYDGRHYRLIRNSYTSGALSETRHYFYSANWQDVEERIGTSMTPNRQFVWGLRFIDDLILRDRDTTGGGVLDERLYALQDALGSVVAVTDPSGISHERYASLAYGAPVFLRSTFVQITASAIDWELPFAGYRLDVGTGLYSVRRRAYNYAVGVWLTRDPLGYKPSLSLYQYANSSPLVWSDPFGLQAPGHSPELPWWGWLWGGPSPFPPKPAPPPPFGPGTTLPPKDWWNYYWKPAHPGVVWTSGYYHEMVEAGCVGLVGAAIGVDIGTNKLHPGASAAFKKCYTTLKRAEDEATQCDCSKKTNKYGEPTVARIVIVIFHTDRELDDYDGHIDMAGSGWTGTRPVAPGEEEEKPPFDFCLYDPTSATCLHANTAGPKMKAMCDTLAKFKNQMKQDPYYNRIAYCVICGSANP
jgi:RHS repeat-associated protein